MNYLITFVILLVVLIVGIWAGRKTAQLPKTKDSPFIGGLKRKPKTPFIGGLQRR